MLSGVPLNVRLGLRYDRTTVDTAGLGHVLQSLTVESADHTAFVFNYGPTTTISAPNDYNYFLPSLDLNLMVRPDLKLRFDASRTATKPPLADLSPTVSPGGRVNALTSTTGNPENRCARFSAITSRTAIVGGTVSGSLTTPLSKRFTFATSAA